MARIEGALATYRRRGKFVTYQAGTGPQAVVAGGRLDAERARLVAGWPSYTRPASGWSAAASTGSATSRAQAQRSPPPRT